MAQCHLVGALGCCAAATEPRLSARLLGASENLRAEVDASINAGLAAPLARAAATATAALGAARFAAEFAAGRRLDRRGAVRLAPREAPPRSAPPTGQGHGGTILAGAKPTSRGWWPTAWATRRSARER
ncbi:hypothetical protein ACFQX7_07470 [Luedemannella flava]